MGSKQFGLGEEGCDEPRATFPATDALERLTGGVAEFPDVLGAEVGQFMLFPIAPQILDGIEFRGVGGQSLGVQPVGLLGEISGDPLAAVDRGSIPQQQDFAGDLAVQGLQKLDHLRALDRTGVQPEVEVARGQPGNRREALPVEVEGQDRGLAARRPGARPVRPLAQPAFVEEDEGAALPAGFFLRRGQVLAFHPAIFASSRSRARPTGRCGLKPSCPSRRHTCTVDRKSTRLNSSHQI